MQGQLALFQQKFLREFRSANCFKGDILDPHSLGGQFQSGLGHQLCWRLLFFLSFPRQILEWMLIMGRMIPARCIEFIIFLHSAIQFSILHA
jgi:hypothetical protein